MLSFSELLEPISVASPTGENETFSVEADAISKARQFDDPSLDQGEWVTDVKEADWLFVYEKCQEFLATRSKDLKIAGWLVEAAAKVKYFEGMAAGFELVTALCDRYWEHIHPQDNNGDNEQRAGNIRWLLTRATQLVKEVPLTEGRATQFAWNDFEAARARAHNSAKQGVSIVETVGHPSTMMLDAARRKSSKVFYKSLLNSILHCQQTVTQLETILDVKLGSDSPSFTPLKDVLDTIHKIIVRHGADVGLKSVDSEAIESNTAIAKSVNLLTLGQPVSEFQEIIHSREQALDQLKKIAEFFRTTEPHSPVAYLAEKAAGWGDLPLHSWLKAVIKDPNSLLFVEEMLGVSATTVKDDS